jgi:hypothetical protein
VFKYRRTLFVKDVVSAYETVLSMKAAEMEKQKPAYTRKARLRNPFLNDYERDEFVRRFLAYRHEKFLADLKTYREYLKTLEERKDGTIFLLTVLPMLKKKPRHTHEKGHHKKKSGQMVQFPQVFTPPTQEEIKKCLADMQKATEQSNQNQADQATDLKGEDTNL